MSQPVDLAGRRFGRLVALRLGDQRVLTNGRRTRRWVCACDCGNETLVMTTYLLRGEVASCGCLVRYRAGRLRLSHGFTRNRERRKEYTTWMLMKARCNNPNNPRFHQYGGRGIRVCERWSGSFANFFADMGMAPSPRHSIDRIDNDGNYEPGNCRWATPNEQAQNRSDQWWITHNGQRKKAREWAKELNLSLSTLRVRRRSGWSVAEILAPRKRARTGEGKRSRLRAVTEQRAP